MTNSVILVAELFILSRISGHLVRTIARVIGIRLLIVLLFPGTVIHELSHLFVAEVLGVKTGEISLVPEGLEGRDGPEGQEIRAGSVAVAKSDPMRRILIGIAPVLVGMGAITTLSYFIRHPPAGLQGDALQNALVFGVFYYLLFAISNSMFSSRDDMKGTIPVFLTLGLVVAAGYAAGFRFSLTGQVENVVMDTLETLTKNLGLVLAFNGVILLGLKILLVLPRLFGLRMK